MYLELIVCTLNACFDEDMPLYSTSARATLSWEGTHRFLSVAEW